LLRHSDAIAAGFPRRVIGMYPLLIVANLAAGDWAALAFRHHPALLGAAVLIGGIEGLRLISGQFGPTRRFRDGVVKLNDNFNGLGFAIIGGSVIAWITLVLIYRYARLDGLEVSSGED